MFFTDAIYRTNQAFEGALKEAYAILSPGNKKKISSYEIEKFLEEENKLKERVLNLFTNYRKDWRNESTHNYQLYFSDQEAFLAIVNICAFLNILLDQMIEHHGIREGKEEAKKIKLSPKRDEDILETIIQLLVQFSTIASLKIKGKTNFFLNKREVIGMLYSYIKESNLGFEVDQDVTLISSAEYVSRIDLLVNKDNQRLIIEIKSSGEVSEEILKGAVSQVSRYLQVNQFTTGIVYIPPIHCESRMIVDKQNIEIGDSTYAIVSIYPKYS